jgi:hypothetical protein
MNPRNIYAPNIPTARVTLGPTTVALGAALRIALAPLALAFMPPPSAKMRTLKSATYTSAVGPAEFSSTRKAAVRKMRNIERGG